MALNTPLLIKMDYNSTDLIKLISSEHGDVIVFDEIDSTNNYVKRNAASLPDRTVVCSKIQTAGRGRRGHTFLSPDGGAYFSVFFRMSKRIADPSSITVCAAVCVSLAIEQLCGIDTEIKWVNDILIHGKKVCGILCESLTTPEGDPVGVICGIGVNLYPPLEGFAEEIATTACAISQFTAPPTPAALISTIADKMYALSPAFDLKRVINDYRRRSCVTGKDIFVLSANGRRGARAAEILDDGSLSVIYDNGEKGVLSSGEISIRIQE